MTRRGSCGGWPKEGRLPSTTGTGTAELGMDGEGIPEMLQVDPRIFATRAYRSLVLLILESLLRASTHVNINDGVEMSDIWSRLRFGVMACGESTSDPCTVTGDRGGG